jgi:parallel beta-helix repeat protein
MKLLLTSSFWQQRYLALLLIVAIAFPQAANAAQVYYVAKNGNDNNPGTSDKPIASIQEAINKAKAGDKVYIKGGTYYLKKPLYISQNGTANARITVQSAPGEKAILDGSQIEDANPHIIGIGGEYIDFKDFKLTNSKKLAVVTWYGKNIRITNNDISNTQNTGVGIYYSKNIEVSKNTVTRSNLNNKLRNKDSGWGQAIGSGWSSQVKIFGNRVYENYGEGIGCFLTSYCQASENTVYDNFSVQMYMDNATNSSFVRNFLYNTGNQDFFRNVSGVWQPGAGIQMANETLDGSSNPLNYNSVRNNIVMGGSYGFFYGSYEKGGGLKNTRILNNTFYGATDTLLSVDADAGHTNTMFANNIFYQLNKKPIAYTPGIKGLNFSHNLWYGNKPNSEVTSAKDIFENPFFVNEGTYQASNYQLQKLSPAINQGMFLNDVGFDYFKNKRPSGGIYDIGAHEHTSSGLGAPGQPQSVPEPSTLFGILLMGSLGYLYKKQK